MGRIGAYRLHATHDSRELTAPARAAFRARFVDEVDPELTLTEPERLRRADAAMRAHMATLSLKSARARRKRAASARPWDYSGEDAATGDASA